MESLFCGAFARAAQILAMYPVDTIKTGVQVSRGVVSSSPQVSSRLCKRLFIRRRCFLSLVGQILYGMLTFSIYESLREYLTRKFPHLSHYLHVIIAAATGDALGSLWLTPSEVVKSKTQEGLYYGAAATTLFVAKAAGPVGFYQRFGAALARDVPFRIIQLSLYEAMHEWYSKKICARRNLFPLENLTLGAITGTLTAAATTTLDVVRTRMMSQTPGANAMLKNALDCVPKTVSKEGLPALYKGIAPRCMLIGPLSAIFFLAYETAKAFCRNPNPKLPAHISRLVGLPRQRAVCAARKRYSSRA